MSGGAVGSEGALPEGWLETTLGDLHDFNPRHPKDADREQAVSFIPMPAVSDELGEITQRVQRILSDVWKGYTHFAENDILFAKITPCMENGKIAIANDLTNGIGCGTTEFHVLRGTEAVDRRLVWYFLRQKDFRRRAERNMTGAVGQRRVPKAYLEAHPFPLPPLAEQARIVAKLDRLTGCSAEARAALDHLPALLDRARQAVLAAACFMDTDGEPYALQPLGELCEDIRYGTSKKCDYDETGIGVLRIPNVANGQIDTSDLKFAKFDEKEIAKLALRTGDILVIRSNGSLDLVGRVAEVGVGDADLLYAGYLIRLRLGDRVDPTFLRYALNSGVMRAKIETLAKSTSGVNNINAKQLSALDVPLPPLTEQAAIVARLGAALARLDALADAAARARADLDRLDRAVLAKAFRGDLVPQDPNDEPASALLERVKAARAASR